MSQNTILDLDALLDSTMDNVPDVPDFVTPPDGLYALEVSDAKIETYKISKGDNKGNEAARIRLTYKIAETVETKGIPVPNNSLFSENFMATEEGLKYFKKQSIKILDVDNVDGTPLREIIESLKGAAFNARVTIKKTKSKDDGQEYENVNVRPIREAAAE